MSTPAIRLDDLIAREVTISWPEAVAVLQALCSESMAAGYATLGFPSPELAELAEDGSIRLLGISQDSRTVASAGALLGTLLERDAPVRLRLMVSQAVAASSPYASIEEFAEALEFFARPDRLGTLRGLFTRAAAAPPRVTKRVVPAIETPAPPPEAFAARQLRPKRSLAAGGVLALAVLVATGWWLVTSSSASAARASARRAASTVTETSGGALERVTAKAFDLAGRLGLVEPVAPPEPELSVPDPDRTRPRSLPSVQASAGVRLPSASPSMVALPDAAFAAAAIASGPSAPAVTEEAAAAVGGLVERVELYSAANSEVVPPVAIYPQLPAEPPANVPDEELAKLQIVVNADGTVAAARLMTPPRSVKDVMLVSAAKAWIFRPAMRDGEAVPYRHEVRITVP